MPKGVELQPPYKNQNQTNDIRTTTQRYIYKESKRNWEQGTGSFDL